MKYLKLFEYINNEDLHFKTDLQERDIDFYTKDEKYDDYEDITANVYWELRFEWMGDVGIDYYMDVHKIEIEYTAVKWDEDEDIREEGKTLIIDDPDNIIVERESNNQQIIVHSIEINKDNIATVIF